MVPDSRKQEDVVIVPVTMVISKNKNSKIYFLEFFYLYQENHILKVINDFVQNKKKFIYFGISYFRNMILRLLLA